jgi:hypothetical protein
MAKVAGWLTNLFWILISLVVGVGIALLLEKYLGRTWAHVVVDVVFALCISLFVGWGAFYIICPKKKRGQLANRITVVISLLAYSLGLMASSLKYLTSPFPQFSFNRFLLEGVLVGIITMSIIYGIAQAIHWAIKGKWM